MQSQKALRSETHRSVLVVLLLVTLAGCRSGPPQRMTQSTAPPAPADTRQGAIQSVAPAVVAPPSPSPAVSLPDSAAANRLYEQALADYQRGNYEAAVVLFKQFMRQSPKSSQAGNAQYLIGEALYAKKQYEAAIVAFDEVVQKYFQDPKVATAMLKEGYAFAELKDTRNARFFLQQVQKRYPNSPEAQQAAAKLRDLPASPATGRASGGASSSTSECYIETPRGIRIVTVTPPDQGGRGYAIQQDFPGIAFPEALGRNIPRCP